MPQARRPRVVTVQRKIHFYRAVVRGKPGSTTAFDPTDVLTHINTLLFNPQGRYLVDPDRVLCCWVEAAVKLGRLRFAIVRRDGLPSIEEGGVERDLSLSTDAGLVEQIHVRCFDDNIVGCDFNFYGPRLPSLARYLTQRGGPKRQRVTFEPLVRRDIVKLLDGFVGVRATTIKIRQSELDHLANIDKSLYDAMEAQRKLGAADMVEVTWHVTPYSRTEQLGGGLFGKIKKLAARKDIPSLLNRFVIDGIPAGGGPSQTLNILDDHLIAEESIARQRGRARGLDHDSAFDAIGRAYTRLEDELIAASSMSVVGDGDGDGN